MHTYLKRGGDTYSIGMWLISPEGHHQYHFMFDVVGHQAAVTWVNILNGGQGIPLDNEQFMRTVPKILREAP